MPQWITFALTAFYIFWLCAVLVFLYLIWRRGVQHTQQLEQALIKATMETAKAAHDASEAACWLAGQIKIIEDKPL